MSNVFLTKNENVLCTTNLDVLYDKAVEKLKNEATDFEQKESGWKLIEVQYIEMRVNKYNPLKASSFIALPKGVQNKHAVVNVQNADNMCFKWAVPSALYPIDDHVDRVSKYFPYQNDLNFKGIPFPVKLSDISKFEKLNAIGINVFYLNGRNQACPLRICEEKYLRIIDLLYLKNTRGEHYAWIKDMSRLLSSQVSKGKSKKFFCRRYLNAFGTDVLLKKHKELCSELLHE